MRAFHMGRQAKFSRQNSLWTTYQNSAQSMCLGLCLLHMAKRSPEAQKW